MGKESNLPKEKEQPLVAVNVSSVQKTESKRSVSSSPKISKWDDTENWKKVHDE